MLTTQAQRELLHLGQRAVAGQRRGLVAELRADADSQRGWLVLASAEDGTSALLLVLPLVWELDLERLEASAGGRLTPRERDVMQQLLSGSTAPEAAARLGITTNTARTYLKRVYRALGVANRAGLAELAARSLVPRLSTGRIGAHEASRG